MSKNKKIVITVILVIVALSSAFGLSRIAGSPKYYKNTIATIQEKESTVTAITVSSAGIATALAAVPSDVTTPIANHILDLSSYLVIVDCVLVFEKSVMTLFGGITTYFLIPLACVLFIAGMYSGKQRNLLITAGCKIIAFGLVLIFIIPLSVKLGDMISNENKEAIDSIVASMNEESDNLGGGEDQGIIDAFIQKIKGGAVGVANKAKEMTTKLVNAIAMFVVCNCLIPIGSVFFFAWVIRILFGININFSKYFDLSKNKLSTYGRKALKLPSEKSQTEITAETD